MAHSVFPAKPGMWWNVSLFVYYRWFSWQQLPTVQSILIWYGQPTFVDKVRAIWFCIKRITAHIKNKSGDSSQNSVSEFHCNRCTGTIATDRSSYINWICRALDISMVSVFPSTPFTYITYQYTSRPILKVICFIMFYYLTVCCYYYLLSCSARKDPVAEWNNVHMVVALLLSNV